VFGVEHVFGAVLVEDGQGGGVEETGAGAQVAHLVGLAELPQTAGHLEHNGMGFLADLFEVHLGRAEGEAPFGGLFGVVDQFGHVEQRFRGDAPAVEAGAAGVGLHVNQGRLQAQVGGMKCGSIAAGTGAHHGEVGGKGCCHDLSGSFYLPNKRACGTRL